MTEITLTHNVADRKTTRLVFFDIEGRSGKVQFLKTLFGTEIPATLKLVGTFAPPRAKETAAERKIRLAALPKLTLEQKIARREQQLAKMKAQLTTGSTPPADPQPLEAGKEQTRVVNAAKAAKAAKATVPAKRKR